MVPGYQIFQIIKEYPYWSKFLQVIFWYCSYTWAEQLIRGLGQWDISFSCRFKGIRVQEHVFWVSSFSTSDAKGPGDHRLWVFTAEEADRTGDRGSGDTTTVDVKTPSETFRNDFLTLDSFPQLQKYQEFQAISLRIRGILLYSLNICSQLTESCPLCDNSFFFNP